MSSILDALERAEQERNASGAAPLQESLSRRRVLWQRPGVWLFGTGLLLLNLLVWWLMLEPETPPAVAEVRPEAEQPVPRPATPPTTAWEALPLATAQVSVGTASSVEPLEHQPIKPLAAATALAKTPVPPLLDEEVIRSAPVPEPPAAQTAVEPAQPQLPLPAPVSVAKVSPPVAPKAPDPRPVEPSAEKTIPAAKDLTAQTPVEPAPRTLKSPAAAPEPAAKTKTVKRSTPQAPKISAEPKVVKPLAEKTEEAVAAEEPRIPPIWELSEKAQKKLKGLEINIHVYHEQPVERFVIIDMRRYREGDPLDRPGLTLERITRDGVVIHYGKGRVKL